MDLIIRKSDNKIKTVCVTKADDSCALYKPSSHSPLAVLVPKCPKSKNEPWRNALPDSCRWQKQEKSKTVSANYESDKMFLF